MNKFLSLLFLSTFAFASCSKEKSAMRKLDGDWTLKSVEVSPNSQNVSDDLPVGTVFSFTKCDDEWCPLQLVAPDGSSVNFAYDISSDASQIIIAETSLSPSAEQQNLGTIDKLSKSEFVFTLSNEFEGETIDITYTLEAE